MRKKTFVFIMLFLLALTTALIISCAQSESDYYTGNDYNNNDNNNNNNNDDDNNNNQGEDENLNEFKKFDDPTSDTPMKFFYFSYDDSLSTYEVELSKYLIHNGVHPSYSLSNPARFLSYEKFDDSDMENLGLFSVSMSCEKISNKYRVGVYVKTDDVGKTERKNSVITIVIDLSISMNEYLSKVTNEQITRLELVKYGLNKMGTSLKEGDILNLVTFSADSEVIAEGITYNDYTNLFMKSANSLKVKTFTNIKSGLLTGYEVAEKYYDSNKSNRIILITDANLRENNVDSAILSYVKTKTVMDATTDNPKEGILLSAMGIGENIYDRYIRYLCREGKGSYFRLNSKKDADKNFTERFSALLNVAARDVFFKIEYPIGLTRTEGAAQQIVGNPDTVYRTNFSYNTSQYFFEEFQTVLSVDETTDRMRIKIYYQDPKDNKNIVESYSETIQNLMMKNKKNLKDAYLIYIFTKQIKGMYSYNQVVNIINLEYKKEDYTEIFSDYFQLMEFLKICR